MNRGDVEYEPQNEFEGSDGKDQQAVERGRLGGRPRGRVKGLFGYADLARILGKKEPAVRKWFAKGGKLATASFEDVLRLCMRARPDLLRALDWYAHEMDNDLWAAQACKRCGLSWYPGLRTIGTCRPGYRRYQSIPGRTIDP